MIREVPFDLVIFDLDGTLVDSVADIARALNSALASANLPTLQLETISRFVGDGAAKLIERASPPSLGSPDQQADLLARFVAAYAANVCIESRLYLGVADLLAALGNASVATAVLTNKPGNLARDLLRALGIADRFAAVIGDGDGFPRKPDPSAAREVIQRTGAEPSRTIVVGDGLPDVRMARAIPCPAIAAGWGYTSARHLQAEHPTFHAPSVQDATRILLPGDHAA
jgi:phosphoglycolate phosphatase